MQFLLFALFLRDAGVLLNAHSLSLHLRLLNFGSNETFINRLLLARCGLMMIQNGDLHLYLAVVECIRLRLLLRLDRQCTGTLLHFLGQLKELGFHTLQVRLLLLSVCENERRGLQSITACLQTA